MKKLLYFNWHSSATEFYRTSGVLPYVTGKGFSITESRETNIDYTTLITYDIILLERPSSYEAINIIKLAKDMGIKVITDWDDDILHLDNLNPMYEVYVASLPLTTEALVLSDEVWVTTKALKKSFSLYNQNIHVIPNAHNDYLFPVKDKKRYNTGGKLALWRGGYTHEGDIYDLGIPEKIIDVVNVNQDWQFLFLGQRFKYLELRCGQNYTSQGGSSTIQFYKQIHQENPNIVFYPLANSLFNKSKSNICWLEATYAGAAFFGNTGLPEFSQVGIKNFDWIYNYISAFREEELHRANEESWDYIKENLLVSQVNQLRRQRITENL